MARLLKSYTFLAYIIKSLPGSCGASWTLIISYGRLYVYMCSFSFLNLRLDEADGRMCIINSHDPGPALHSC